MHIVGLDLGKRKSQVCVGTENGEIVVERRISTTRSELSGFFANYAPARVLVESSTGAEWVARHLESLGLTVVVGDPRFGPMYAQSDKRIKTDKRDSRALMTALRLGAFREAHRRSDASRDLRARLLVRANLVRARTRLIAQVRSLYDSRGVVIRSCHADAFADVVDATSIADGDRELAWVALPAVTQIGALDAAIAEADAELVMIARQNPVAVRLDCVAGVGTITALAFVCAVEDPRRFANARELASYFGFVPREKSSGDKNRRGTTTRVGDTLTRSYLIQAAWSIMRSKRSQVAPLKAWAANVAERRGSKVAVNALARRLTRILYAMWRDDADFDASKFAPQTL
jgi:transposase